MELMVTFPTDAPSLGSEAVPALLTIILRAARDEGADTKPTPLLPEEFDSPPQRNRGPSGR